MNAPQKPLELILMRQLAAYLAMPIMIADHARTLLYFNPAAEVLLGRRYAETQEMRLEEWMAGLHLYDEAGQLIPPEERPLPVVLRERRPVHRRLRLRNPDGPLIEATVLPLEGQGGRHLGAAIIFWELPPR